jgi:mRNA interferase RelE/StbE
MNVIFLKPFLKDLRKLEDKQVKDDVKAMILMVENAENQSDIPHLKKMQGYSIAYRIRVGKYRIGVLIENDTVEFAALRHRKDIYKFFP